MIPGVKFAEADAVTAPGYIGPQVEVTAAAKDDDADSESTHGTGAAIDGPQLA
jgi:hypothetical protein